MKIYQSLFKIVPNTQETLKNGKILLKGQLLIF